jgi:hypothetical protein
MFNLKRKSTSPDATGATDNRVYFLATPDCDTDAAWLRRKFKYTTGGNIYIISGEANHDVYNQLEPEMRHAVESKGATIHILAGPIISIPWTPGVERKQDGREFPNSVVKLAAEDKLKLYPSPERQEFHYRVFDRDAITNITEHHPLSARTSGSWYFYGSRAEADGWEKAFLASISGLSPVRKDFLRQFLFLTGDENEVLKKWAARQYIDINKIKLGDCRDFWRFYAGE